MLDITLSLCPGPTTSSFLSLDPSAQSCRTVLGVTVPGVPVRYGTPAASRSVHQTVGLLRSTLKENVRIGFGIREGRSGAIIRRQLVVVRPKQRVLLRFASRARLGRPPAHARNTPANAGQQKKHDEDTNDHVQDGPIAIGLGDAPEEENVRHPEALAHAISRFSVANTVARAVILADCSPNACDRCSED